MAVCWVVAAVSALLFIADLSEADGNNTTVQSNITTGYTINQTTGNLDWWQTAVIYQIYPLSFKDSNGDGVGDIQGIISKLDYIADTEISAIYLSPIFKSPMVDNGYDISDYKSIDPVFGTFSDFDELKNKSKAKGIKLILDFVPNHSSDRHEWFQKSSMKDDKYKDYYIWANGRVNETTYERLPPNNWLSAFEGSAWTWNEDRGQYYLHSYSHRQPDLNHRNPDVVKEMKDVLKFWLDKGVDGFRVDAVHHLFEDEKLQYETRSNNTRAKIGDYDSLVHNLTIDQPDNYELVVQWRQLLDEHSKKDEKTRVLIVEDSRGNVDERMSYYGTTDKPGAHFPFNFDIIKKIVNGSNAKVINSTIMDWFLHVPQGHWYNWAAGMHDQRRVASRLGPHMVDAINMLIMLLPGTAFTYNGEEIGMQDTTIEWNQTVDSLAFTAGRNRSRDPERTPFQWDDTDYAGFSTNKTWLPVNSNYKSLNLKTQLKSSHSHYIIYKRLVMARKKPVIQRGNLNIRIPHPDIFSFARELNESDIFIFAMNLGTNTTLVDLSQFSSTTRNLSVYASSINSSFKLDKVVSQQRISLRAKEAIVLTSNDFMRKSAASLNIASLPLSLITFALIALLNSMFIS